MNHLERFKNHETVKYDRLPDIQLYMDQLLDLLDQNLSDLKREEDQVIFTKTMINNYVKSKVIRSPEKKKYSKEALAELMMVFYFKQVFSIQDTKRILELTQKETMDDQFENFAQTVKAVFDNLPSEDSQSDDLEAYLLDLAVEASIKKQLAEHLLDNIYEKKESNSSETSSQDVKVDKVIDDAFNNHSDNPLV